MSRKWKVAFSVFILSMAVLSMLIIPRSISFSLDSLQCRILFDNSHLQTAGNADWTITGGFSDFADALKEKGYEVSQWGSDDPRRARHDSDPDITLDILKNYDVLIIPEPNDPFTAQEQRAVLKYIENGGAVFFISDHNGADRNHNGWDAVSIFNGWKRGNHNVSSKDIFSEDFVGRLGFRFSYDNRWQKPVNDIAKNAPFMSSVNSIGAWGASSIVITGDNVKPAAYYRDGDPYVVYGHYGKGSFIAIGDSSPFDDGTGTIGDKLYDGWHAYDDAKFATGVVSYLCEKSMQSSTVSIKGHSSEGGSITPDFMLANVGENVSMAITASLGWHIDKVYLGKKVVYEGHKNTDDIYVLTFTATKNVDVLATFSHDIYPVDVSLSGNGKISWTHQDVKYGEKISLDIRSNEGWHVDSVLVNGKKVYSGTRSDTHITLSWQITSTTDVIVSFSVNVYRITTTVYGKGFLEPGGTLTATYGSDVFLKIIPAEHYKIREVLLDGQSLGPVESISLRDIHADHSIEVYFEKKEIHTVVLYINSRDYYVDGELREMDVAPFINKENRTMVPVRFIAEAMGLSVRWDGKKRQVIITAEDKKVILTIDSQIAVVNGNPIKMDTKAVIVNGRTFVPLRFVAEAFGFQVEWDQPAIMIIKER